MKLKLFRSAAALVALAGLAAGAAQARDNVYWSVGIDAAPGVSVGVGNVRPVYPAPVYLAPAPVYVAPQPVYLAPQPVYVRPAPVYYAAPVYYGKPHKHKHKRHHRHWD